MPWFVVLAALLAACGQPAAPRPEPPKPEPVVEPEPPPPRRPAREVFAVGPSPMSIAVVGDALVWSDTMGAIWTMPSAGGTPRELASPDFAFKVVAAGDGIVATTRKDVMRVDLDGGATKLDLALPEYPEEVVADAAAVYVTLFKQPAIMRIADGRARKIGQLARGVLAVRGDTLYAASYSTGVLVEMPATGGGKPRTIARGLVRPTALAVDATHAYVYGEKERTLRRIDLASGAATVIARDLVNSDDLVLDGDWLYTRSWDRGTTGSVVRIAKDGSVREALGEDLAAPYNIAVDAEAIYVTARDAGQIVRFDKAALVR